MLEFGFIQAAPACWLQISGEDASRFLQSQFSADLSGPVGQAVPGLWLDHRARIQAESTLLKVSEDRYFAFSVGTPVDVLRAKLERHIIADDVELDDATGEVGVLLVAGAQGRAALERWLGSALPGEGEFLYRQDGYVFPARRGLDNAFEVVADRRLLEGLREALEAGGGKAFAPRELKAARLAARMPLIPAEVGPDETPAEAGLEHLCSLTKGCYLGQEVVNRQARLDRSARTLVPLLIEGELPDNTPPRLPLESGGAVVGELRGWVSLKGRTRALAMIKSKAVDLPLTLSGHESIPLKLEKDG